MDKVKKPFRCVMVWQHGIPLPTVLLDVYEIIVDSPSTTVVCWGETEFEVLRRRPAFKFFFTGPIEIEQFELTHE